MDFYFRRRLPSGGYRCGQLPECASEVYRGAASLGQQGNESTNIGDKII